MLDPFQLEFVQRGVLELLLLCVGAGLLGTWIVLRGLAFHAHASGSATFPGLVLADGLGFAAPLGALGAAVAFALAVAGLGRSRRGGIETVIALVLVGALSLGVILASDVFHSGSGIETLLFGSLLTIQDRDLWLAGAASGVTLLATILLGRAWLASGFDADAARALGLRSALPDLLLMALIALVVTATISAVGALMTASLLVVPAATVRVWTSRLPAWQASTVLLVAIEGAVGLWLSVKLNAPPGATLAVLAGGVFACAALAGVARARASARRRGSRGRGAGAGGLWWELVGPLLEERGRGRHDHACRRLGRARWAATQSMSTGSCSRTPTRTTTSRDPRTSRRSARPTSSSRAATGSTTGSTSSSTRAAATLPSST